MDGGSQRSYLTQRTRNSLHLQTTNRRRLAIASFGAKRSDPQLCKVVRVSLRTREGEDKSVDVPHICEPLTTQPIDKCLDVYSHLSGLELADDPLDETREKDMLIGSDFYSEFVTGEVVRGTDGPIAINTTLGWMLSGPANLIGHQGFAVNLVTTHTLRVDDGVTNKTLDATLGT